MPPLQMFKDTLLQGKCELIGHKILKSEIDEFNSKQMNSMYTHCTRCHIPLQIVRKNNNIRARARY